MFGIHNCGVCRQDTPIKGEQIIAAACWYPDLEFPHQIKDLPKTHYLPKNIKCGIVYCSRNHLQSMYICYQTFGLRQNELNEIDGFLTSENRFVGRDEAGVIAYHAGQIPEVKHLFSEDLFDG